eukprot:8800697-Ditylum_brightwellii.AAC.1
MEYAAQTLVTQLLSCPSLVHHQYAVTTKQSSGCITISNRPLSEVLYSGDRSQGMMYQKEHLSDKCYLTLTKNSLDPRKQINWQSMSTLHMQLTSSEDNPWENRLCIGRKDGKVLVSCPEQTGHTTVWTHNDL